MAYISKITPLGSSESYDLKAAMLTHTPNNTTTFLRGDNTWSNTLTGELTAVNFNTRNTTTNGSQIRFQFSNLSNATYGLMWATRSQNYGGRLYFGEYAEDANGALTGAREQYLLPTPTQGRTSTASFDILTSKSTITIAQGGTDATTAGAAANNLLSGLPTWTANPTDDTYFIRRDTGGSATFGQVKASTIYNYIKGKTDTVYAPISHNHYQLVTEGDNRSVATTPNSYNNNLVFRGLKTNSAFGSPSSDTYSYVVGLRGWSDSSGGNAYELAFNNTGIYCRKGATTSWGSWDKIVTLSDGNSAYVKKAGDTMSGNLIVSKTGDTYVEAKNTTTGCRIEIDVNDAGKQGLWSSGYYANSTYTASSKWIYYRGTDGEAHSDVKIYGAVWNDYAEYRITKDIIEPGRCVIETGKDDLVLSTERLQPGAEIVSDTFGFAIGETDEAKTPIASNGRVLAYIYEGREAARAAIGKPVCSGPDGTVSIMTDEEYQKYGYCAIGTISAVPDYEEWGTENIKVNNRIWIRIR